MTIKNSVMIFTTTLFLALGNINITHGQNNPPYGGGNPPAQQAGQIPVITIPAPPIQGTPGVPLQPGNEVNRQPVLPFLQYPLPIQPVSAEYAPQQRTATALLKVFKVGGGSITYQMRKNPQIDNTWILLSATKGNSAKETYLYNCLLDSKADIISEQNIIRKKNRQGSSQEVIQEITVILGDDPMLGKNKTIAIKFNLKKDEKGDAKNKEWIVGPEAPIVTFTQIVAWIGTIRQIPPEGVMVRWILDERPLPFIVKAAIEGENWVCTMYAAPNLEIKDAPNEFLFKFVYNKNRLAVPEFVFPAQIQFNVQGNIMVLDKVK